MNDILKTLVPGIATALGGPLAGIATGWLADKLGVPDKTVTSITDAVQGIDPLAREKLEQEFNRWFIEQQYKERELYVKDIEDARARDSVLRTAGQRNYRADSMYLLAIVVVVAMVAAIWFKEDINEYVKGIMTLVLGRFLGYVDSIYGFEFGTTRSSQTKDATINKLSDKGGE